MTKDKIKNTPELVDYLLDKSIIADSRKKLRERMDEICNLAIKALEQEPCEDAVSRASVFEIMGNLLSIPYDFDRNITEKDVSESMDKIRELPRVTPQEPRWIPVTERLPEEGQMVIACYPSDCGKRVMTAYYYNKECGFSCGITYAWMPLPEPYKAGK